MKENLEWASALAAVLRGGAAFVRGDLDRARRSYREAGRAFAELDMEVHALAAEARLAAIEGGESGAAARLDHLAKVGERGVRNPERFVEMLVP